LLQLGPLPLGPPGPAGGAGAARARAAEAMRRKVLVSILAGVVVGGLDVMSNFRNEEE
jgi:hypothetical protein